MFVIMLSFMVLCITATGAPIRLAMLTAPAGQQLTLVIGAQNDTELLQICHPLLHGAIHAVIYLRSCMCPQVHHV
jgi:hypothetical protein